MWCFLPDGLHAYVNAENDGAVGIIDTTKNEMTGTIQLGTPGEVKPMGMVLTADGKKLYVTTGKGKSVFVIDTGTNQILTSFESGAAAVGYRDIAGRQESFHGKRTEPGCFSCGYGDQYDRQESEMHRRPVGHPDREQGIGRC